MASREDLERENREMKARIEALEARKGKSRREQILEATRVVAARKGFDADLRDILEEASISSTTFYRHFVTREEALQEVVIRMRDEAIQKTTAMLEIEDGLDRMMAFIRFSFDDFSHYGLLSNEIAIGKVPHPYENMVDSEGFWKFIGRIVSDCKRQGHCRSDVDTRVVVRTFVWLVQPFRMNWCRADGMSDQEIAEETMDIFFSAFAANPPTAA